ncbi:MAG: carboxypeptidase regulatory-like domain-containing protein [Desulfobacterales bacterium]|nr:carboxypeptidase regulatory-like domain-containing protein [Desulfobacterales bacterium]
MKQNFYLGIILTICLAFFGCKKISGQITYNGAGLEGVKITLSGGASESTSTDKDGKYAFSFDGQNASYTVTPIMNGYTFTPAKTTFQLTSDEKTGVNFAAEYNGQVQASTWAMSYFGQDSPYPKGWLNPVKKQYDYSLPWAVTQTTDKGYIFCGGIRTFEENDAMIMRLDEKGNITKGLSIHGGSGYGELRQSNMLFSIIQTSDGGFLAAGSSNLNDSGNVLYGNNNMWLVKLDSSMNLVWSNAYGIKNYNEKKDYQNDIFLRGFAYSIIEDGQGGYIIGGTQLAKIDYSGALIWSKDVPFGSIKGLTMLSDGTYIAIANSGTTNRIAKISANGDIEWNYAYEVNGLATKLYSVEAVSNSAGESENIIFVGRLTYNELRSSDWLLVCLDLNGQLLWQKTLGGNNYDPNNLIFSDEQAFAIIKSNDGNYIIGGESESFDSELNHDDAVVVKINKQGSILWQKAYHMGNENLTNLSRTESGFVFSGKCFMNGSNNSLIVTCDNNGDIANQGNDITIKSINFNVSIPNGIIVDKNQEILIEDIILQTADTNSISRTLTTERMIH